MQDHVHPDLTVPDSEQIYSRAERIVSEPTIASSGQSVSREWPPGNTEIIGRLVNEAVNILEALTTSAPLCQKDEIVLLSAKTALLRIVEQIDEALGVDKPSKLNQGAASVRPKGKRPADTA